jgi:ABC-type branched-subunit amino acid transport system ATPase component
MLLEVRNMAVAYGTARVLDSVSLTVDGGESVTLIGANGAGKTSCLRAISGLVPLAGGEVWFGGARLMARPKLLLVDEPSVGLAPLMVRELSRTLRDIHREGVAILLVEQNAAMALALAGRGYLLETGRVMAQGDTATLRANDYVRRAYLGV